MRSRADGCAHFDDSLGLDEVRTAAHDDSRLVLRRDFVHRLPQRLKILKPTRSVCIDHQQPPPAPMHHPMPDRASFPHVLLQHHDAHVRLRVCDRELERKLGRPVAAPVIDDDDLARPRGSRAREVRERRLEHRGQARSLVVCGHDDGEVYGRRIGDEA